MNERKKPAINKNMEDSQTNLKRTKAALKLQCDKLLNDQNCKERYTGSVKSKYNELNEKENSKLDTKRNLVNKIIP